MRIGIFWYDPVHWERNVTTKDEVGFCASLFQMVSISRPIGLLFGIFSTAHVNFVCETCFCLSHFTASRKHGGRKVKHTMKIHWNKMRDTKTEGVEDVQPTWCLITTQSFLLLLLFLTSCHKFNYSAPAHIIYCDQKLQSTCNQPKFRSDWRNYRRWF